MNNPACEPKTDEGPIPSGNFLIYGSQLNDISPFDTIRFLLGGADWGDWYVPIVSPSGYFPYGRRGFYLHGGFKQGTKGCISVGGGLLGNVNSSRVMHALQENEVSSIWVE